MSLAIRASVLILVLAGSGAAAAEPRELVTAPDAVLCLDAASLGRAAEGAEAQRQDRLRDLGCLKSPAGVPVTLLSAVDGVSTWSVRFRPQGISGGLTLWGRPSAFTLPDGTPLRSLRAAR
jgi:hypothetical protein